MTITVKQILRFPLKGLSADYLSKAALTAGEGIPHDRRFALARASSTVDPENPEWQPKTNFLMLQRNATLATLETRYDEDAETLAVLRNDAVVAEGAINTPEGRSQIENFFYDHLKDEINDPPHLVEMPKGHMFSDHKKTVLSLINMATVRELEKNTGTAIDPIRFRGNIHIDGAEPWAEFDWIDQGISIGSARFKATERIDRCVAANVNPGSGDRSVNVLKVLQKNFGHVDMGIYLEVTEDGEIATGDEVKILGP